ncbi:MAG TPA: IS110 family transposase, partial [Hyphomonas sp.]|nr:IS110 family transposase [Hyphomonas sp.]
MARIHSIAQDAVLVAIDISKKRNDVLIQMPGSPRRRRLVVLNQRAEHDRFIQRLKAFDRPVVTGFEATGNYHRALAWRLVDAGIKTRLISSMALARQREAIHNGWDKNDPKDAQVILHMLATGLSQVYLDPLVAGLADIQELSKTHEAVSRARTQTIHRILTHYLPLYFPEIEKFLGSSRRDWFFALLETFPPPASITALSPEAFSAAAWDIVGKKVSKARLIVDICETAKESIGLPVPVDSRAIAMFR